MLSCFSKRMSYNLLCIYELISGWLYMHYQWYVVVVQRNLDSSLQRTMVSFIYNLLCLYVPFLSLTSSVFPTFIFVFLARISTVLGVLWCWNNFLRELHYAWWRHAPTVLTDKKSIWWYGYIRSHTYVISIDWFSRSENNEKEFC